MAEQARALLKNGYTCFEPKMTGHLESLDAIDVSVLCPSAAHTAQLADYLSPQSWFLLLEPAELEHQGRIYVERLDSPPSSKSQPQAPNPFPFPGVWW